MNRFSNQKTTEAEAKRLSSEHWRIANGTDGHDTMGYSEG